PADALTLAATSLDLVGGRGLFVRWPRAAPLARVGRAIDLRRRRVEARREAVGGEGGCDLLHLADPAPALRVGGAPRSVGALLELGQRVGPFGEQLLFD